MLPILQKTNDNSNSNLISSTCAGTSTRKKKTTVTTTMIITQEQLNEYDILCGKDSFCNSHTGSRIFRRIIEQYSSRYSMATTKPEKMDITKEIYENFCSSGTRFVKRKRKDQKCWEELTPVAARDKVSHALRFINKNVNRKSMSITTSASASTSTNVTSSNAANKNNDCRSSRDCDTLTTNHAAIYSSNSSRNNASGITGNSNSNKKKSNSNNNNNNKQHIRGHRRIVSNDSATPIFATSSSTQTFSFKDSSTMLNQEAFSPLPPPLSSPKSSPSSLLTRATEVETTWYHRHHHQYQSPSGTLNYPITYDHRCMSPISESNSVAVDEPIPLSQVDASPFSFYNNNNQNHQYYQSYEPIMMGNNNSPNIDRFYGCNSNWYYQQ